MELLELILMVEQMSSNFAGEVLTMASNLERDWIMGLIEEQKDPFFLHH